MLRIALDMIGDMRLIQRKSSMSLAGSRSVLWRSDYERLLIGMLDIRFGGGC